MKLRVLVVVVLAMGAFAPAASAEGELLGVPGLRRPVHVTRDALGIPHIRARSDHDVFFANGYLQAEDRFFQMDVAEFFSRRAAYGTRAEVLGPGEGDVFLSGDTFIRTLGLRQAAERSAAAYPRWVMADLQAYADGVNAWLAGNPLPAEYGALELTKASVPPWTPVDSIAVFRHLTTAISLTNFSQELENTGLFAGYQEAGQALGFDGAALFFDDVGRVEPFDHTITRPPGATTAAGAAKRATTAARAAKRAAPALRRDQVAEAAAFVRRARVPSVGSNWWLVAGDRSASGRAMLAGDPHLPLPSPAVWHELGLTVSAPGARMHVYGGGIPGVPGVVQGFNDHLMWSSTVNPIDDADFFQERVVVQDGVPVATVHKGIAEPLEVVQEHFRANRLDGVPDDVETLPPGPQPGGLTLPAATYVVPRLGHGPLLTAPDGAPGEETAIGVAFTALAPTRELEAVLRFDRARSLGQFRRGVRFFDSGTQNWGVADVRGNIGYFTGAEVPLREDLQDGAIAGLPPSLVRDGTGALPNEWIPDPHPARDQALPFEILPFEEMPTMINPRRGFIASANNDPVGTSLDNDPFNRVRPGGGIYYLGWLYANGSRVGRITRLLEAEIARRGRVSRDAMARIQGDVQQVDAQVLRPFIERAYRRATAPGAPAPLAAVAGDPGVTEAVSRLRAWDTSTPTGIPEGYDASDVDGVRAPPSKQEVANSVAASIYALWRSRILANTVSATLARVGLDAYPGGYDSPDDTAMVALRHLLDTFPATHGMGASGLSFFDADGVALQPADERDLLILDSLREALDLAASPAFAPAFGGSTDQDDYRWGRLHRVVLSHPLGGSSSIPTGGGFSDLAPDLPGLATDGGYDTVDFAQHAPRADGVNGFMYAGGASKRFVGVGFARGIAATEVIAGGERGDPADPAFGDQVGLWLTNDAHPAGAQP